MSACQMQGSHVTQRRRLRASLLPATLATTSAAALAYHTVGRVFVSAPSERPRPGLDAVQLQLQGAELPSYTAPLRGGATSGRAATQAALSLTALMGAATRLRGLRSKPSMKAAAAEDRQSADEIPAWLPRALLLMFALFCSTNFTFIKVLEDGHSEAAVQAVRFCAALVPFLPVIHKHSSKQSMVSGGEIGLWCALAYIAQAVGLPHTEASKGAFLCSLTMLVVPLVKSIFGAKVPTQIWAAVLLAMAGTALLLGVGMGGGDLFASLGWGELCCSLTALGFGFMFVRMDEYAKEPDFDTLGCTIWQVVTLAASMVTWLLVTEGAAEGAAQVTSLLSGGPEVLATLFWVSVVTTAGVLFVETWAMERMDGTEAGIIFASEPVWATIFASVMLGESFGVKEGLGGCLIVLACIMTQVKFDSAEEKAPLKAPLEEKSAVAV
eukprot:TRINITY_DN33606_c0_g1_i1.p1 TRINITY_DN33606_c0_g1~~TRINITY_DN33606_c0_g1_i1.p1  ORF type:complete len:458 (+),score=94.58 TRINITY_DN33606_c0_g1_i1:59-1375(+)